MLSFFFIYIKSLGSHFDPTRRPWYHRATASVGKYTISTPYVDSGGVGLVNTISAAIYENPQHPDPQIKDKVCFKRKKKLMIQMFFFSSPFFF